MKIYFQTIKKAIVLPLIKLTAIALIVLTTACNEERLFPTPLPQNVTLTTLGYGGVNGRIGAGDFTKDTLLEISGVPEDGLWQYRLDIGGYVQEGTMNVIDSKARFANFLRTEWWLALNKESGDSVKVEIEIIAETLGFEKGSFTTSFKKEMYDLRTWQDVQAIQYDLAGEYTLHNDISFPDPAEDNFPELGFMPIGGTKGLNNAFTGKLTGDGYTLKNFFINREYLNYVGLFGVLSYMAEVKNLRIELSGLGIRGYNYVGGLAGLADKNTVIEDCKLEGDIYGNNYVGGLVGSIGDNSSISLSRFTGNITGNSKIGGVIGYCAIGSNIDYCFSNVIVNATDCVGGLIGVNNGKVTNCQVDNITLNGAKYIGGLTGWNNGALKNCVVKTGEITGDSITGGMAGYSGSSASINMACSKTNVTGNIVTGGFIGQNLGEVINCYSTGANVSGSVVCGGFIGESSSLVKNCYADNTTANTSVSGGFIGDKTGTITNCYWNEDRPATPVSTGNGDSFGIEKKSTGLFKGFDPSTGGVREIFLGWDFMEIWIILPSKNKGFPYLTIERELSLDF